MASGHNRWLQILVRPVNITLSVIIALLALAIFQGFEGIIISITVFIAALWISEAMPLFVTALLGSVLFILAGMDAKVVFEPYFSPTVALILGGFAIALALNKHHIDKKFIVMLLEHSGGKPRIVIAMMMVATAFLSLWVSNTAAAAIMIPIAMTAAHKTNYIKAAILCVAFAATVGGIGTLVGTPPNAIAAAALMERGIEMNFFQWMVIAIPFVAIMLVAVYSVVTFVYPPEKESSILKIKTKKWASVHTKTVGVALLIALLWLSSPIHRVPDSAISVFGIVLLYLAGSLEKEDLNKLNWAVILLVGGSLSLGNVIDVSGVSVHIGNFIENSIDGRSEIFVFGLIAAVTSGISSFVSNTSTAALIIPIMLAISESRELASLVAISSSINFISPAGTPPSAMAFGYGHLRVVDMLKVGIPLTIIGIVVVSALAFYLW